MPDASFPQQHADIRYEIYFDESMDKYYVFTDFENPNGTNLVEDELVIVKKDNKMKVDINESIKINRDEVKNEFKREACIHCD